MASEEEIIEAVKISQKAYQLLLWVEKAMNDGFISPKSAHSNMSESEVTKEWLVEHIENIPPRARPDIEREDELQKFCSYFSTFLITTFEMVENPGKRLYSDQGHCFCPMCSFLVDVSHLRPKKVTKHDKSRAKKLKKISLSQLCIDLGVEYPADDFEFIINDVDLKRYVAMVAYGDQLVQRVKGVSNGASVLVLWREFAWHKEGSPIKDFKFDEKMILKARVKITELLKS